MCCGAEAGSYLRLIAPCITQLKTQGPSRTCNESKEDEEERTSTLLGAERITSTEYESWNPTSSPNNSSLPRENVSCTCGMGGRGWCPSLGLAQLCCLPILKLTCWVCGRHPTALDRGLRQGGHLTPTPKRVSGDP